MTALFVAVVPSAADVADTAGSTRAVLLAAGASAVLSWAELASGGEPDDARAVLFEHADQAEMAAFAQLSEALDSIDGAAAAIVSTRPVTDTLKLVDADGRLRGTAERDQHRVPAAPIVTSIGLLRAVAAGLVAGPDPIAVLIELAARGVPILDWAAWRSTPASSSAPASGSAPAAASRPAVSSTGVRLAGDPRRR